jgi:hypothetical protein
MAAADWYCIQPAAMPHIPLPRTTAAAYSALSASELLVVLRMHLLLLF